MEREQIIKLTLALYKVTELFEKKEPLRFFLRKKALEILSNYLLLFAENFVNLKRSEKDKIIQKIFNDIEIIKGYLDIGRAQHIVAKQNFFILKREYIKLKKELKEELQSIKEEKGKRIERETKQKDEIVRTEEEVKPVLGREEMNGRCKKILEILKQKGAVQVKDVKEVFPEVTKRTLRRDFDYLLEKGFIERLGQGNSTFYRLKE